MRLPRLILAAAALTAAAPVLAQASAVSLSSEVFVLRSVPQADGSTKEQAEAPERVLPGDPILIQLDYMNAGAAPATNFTAVNAIPDGLSFTGTQSLADYSVDGGRSWGALTDLTVAADDGTSRAAQSSDVTHLRFKTADAVPVGAKGQFSFRAVVK